jgi:hypothetical protein
MILRPNFSYSQERDPTYLSQKSAVAFRICHFDAIESIPNRFSLAEFLFKASSQQPGRAQQKHI